MALLLTGAGLSLALAACGGAGPDAAGPRQPHGKGDLPTSHAPPAATPTTGPAATPTTAAARAPGLPGTTTPTTAAARTAASPGLPGTTTPTTAAAPQSPGFQGIFEFAGNNASSDAADSDLAGVVLVYYWSQIEPQKGVFDWSVVDDDMAPWVAAGKKVILRISTSGYASWDPPYSGSATPQWVYGDGADSITDNGETIPVYWDPAYLADYKGFVQALAQRFDGDPSVAFIEPGIGMGGETLPETNVSAAGIGTWQSAGYTDTSWLSTVETIASFFAASFRSTPVFPLVDMTFFDGNSTDYDTVMAWLRAIPNWGLQYDGLGSSSMLNSEWFGRPIALEQRNATSTSHDCLCADISNALDNLHAAYLLIYQSDIDNPANSGYLAQAAAEVQAR
jgi:hypothetical protein